MKKNKRKTRFDSYVISLTFFAANNPKDKKKIEKI